MATYTTTEVLFMGGCLTYILSGVICGIIRWLHMCKPYNENGEYFYPGRKQMTFFFVAIILQFPYLINPMDDDTWTYIRLFGILYYPIGFSLLFKRYFSRERLKRNNRKILYFFITFFVIGVMLISVFFFEKTLILSGENWLLAIMGLFSLLLTVGYLQETHRIKKCIKKLNEDSYSNYEDFPYYFAKKIYYSPLIWIIIMWIIFVSGSHWIKFIMDIFCSIWMVVFLSIILHPQQFFSNNRQKERQDKLRTQISDIVGSFIGPDSEEEGDIEEDIEDDTTFECSQEVKQEVLDTLLLIYKQPHLKKTDLMKEISLGNKKEANQFIVQIGYYNLVNMFRLQYAKLYASVNTNATIDEVAEQSGFTSRYALNNAKKKVVSIDLDLVKGVTMNQ